MFTGTLVFFLDLLLGSFLPAHGAADQHRYTDFGDSGMLTGTVERELSGRAARHV